MSKRRLGGLRLLLFMAINDSCSAAVDVPAHQEFISLNDI
jgi:hypothetical protein